MPDLDKSGKQRSSSTRLSPRAIAGLVIAAACLVFVFSNTQEVQLRFMWVEISAPGWLLLALLLALGVLAGFLIGRSRYKKGT